MIKLVAHKKTIMPTIFAISWFWFIGAVMLTKLPDYTHYVLRANASVFAVFLAAFSIGIALGSMTINRLLTGLLTLRYVPHTMLLLSVFAGDLYWATPTVPDYSAPEVLTQFFGQFANWRIAIDLFFLAFSGGLYVVPLYTYLQVVSDDAIRARTIATNNIMNAMFMVLSTVLVMFLLHYHVAIPEVFLILAVLNAGAALIFKFSLPRTQDY